MRFTVFDVETDGLLETVTRIHCLSYQIYENTTLIESGTLLHYEHIRAVVLQRTTLVGHNIVRYDIPVLEKILNITITARLIDTLGLSWNLYPNRMKHGLEVWGEEFGVPKPEITDWENLTPAEYAHRCVEDVKITVQLYFKQLAYLFNLYERDVPSINKLINYITFKLDCIREQEEEKCSVDIEKLNLYMAQLEELKASKFEILKQSMPSDIKYKTVTKPSRLTKANGDYSVRGEKWIDLLFEHNLPADYEGEIRVIKEIKEGNPDSPAQVKAWLFSFGWDPAVYEERVNTAGEVKEVPQVYIHGKLCDSVKALYHIEPNLETLDMLSLVKHRLGV